MKYTLEGGDAFPAVRVLLDAGESIKAESNAMVAMSGNLKLSGKMEGGIFGAIGRKLLTGESFFLQEISAKKEGGWALLAAGMPGQTLPVALDDTTDLIVQKNAFLAATPDVKTGTKVQNLVHGLFSGEGFFVIRLSGKGTAFLSAFGAVDTLNLADGEEVIIDNGHLVAWDADMKYSITKGGTTWVSSVTSGEGLACRFTGPGRVLIQTRNPVSFGAWTTNYIAFPKNH